jgi:hypothetical protein
MTVSVRSNVARTLSHDEYLRLDDCRAGADGFTGATVRASIGVYHVLGISLRYCIKSALRKAGTTHRAFIRDLICHNASFPFLVRFDPRAA